VHWDSKDCESCGQAPRGIENLDEWGTTVVSELVSELRSCLYISGKGGRGKSTLIHTSSGIRAGILSVYFRQKEEAEGRQSC
jgi:hypothetical protein